MRRTIMVAGAITVLVAGLAEPASGAMCLRWEDPGPQRVGRPIVVGFRTLVPVVLADGTTRMDPYVASDYPFRVQVHQPGGGTQRLAVSPDPADPQRWSGRFTAHRDGTWTVSVTNFSSVSEADSDCYTALRIAVRAAGEGISSPVAVVIAAGVLLVIGLGVGVALRRRVNDQARGSGFR